MPQKLKFKEYPILKLLVGLIIGIIAAHAGIELTIQWYYWLIGILVLGGLAWPKKYLFNYNYRFISGFIIYFVFVLFGFLLYQFQSNSKQENYYGNLLSFDNQYIVRIIDLPQQKPKSIKLFVEVHSVLSNDHLQPSIGKALIYLQNDSFAKQVYYGDLLAIDSDFSPIAASSNPDQFDYKSYLSLQDIHYQSYIRSGSWKLLEHTTGFDIKLFALKLRAKLIEILYANQLSEDELSVAAGMLLGVRDMLSPDLKQAYAGAGAMHILCVSGLHVGIIFLILNSVLGALNYRKSHRALKALLILSFIWFYALLTGLSPSVVRSATMFTFIVIGQNVNRHVNILGSLSASALVILVVQPNLLFDLGFQLSYSAVVSIVVLQKPIASLWNPPNLILDKAWQLIAVSVAAQIGTAPISLYYFHQFPNLFILTNLLVIPAAYLVINLGIAVLALSFISPVSSFIGLLLNYLLKGLNYSILHIEAFEYGVTRNIYISPSMLVIATLLIISSSLWLIGRRKKMVFVSLALACGLLFLNETKYDLTNELTVYHANRNTYVAVYSQHEAWIFCDTLIYKDATIASFPVANHELVKGTSKRNYISLESDTIILNSVLVYQYPFLKIGDKVIEFASDLSIKPRFKVDYILMNQKMINRDILQNSNSQLIVGANLAPWHLKSLNEVRDSMEIAPYFVSDRGAFTVTF